MHVLFNNAGVAREGWFEDVDPDDADLTIDVNLKGVINGIYAALPLLREANGARIINVASVAGIAPLPRAAIYTAAKHAVCGLSDALDIEFERHGVRVVTLLPWFIDTPILDATAHDANTSMHERLAADKVVIYPVAMAAARAWDAAHGKASRYMVGKEAENARMAARFFPGALRARLRKMMPGG
jgi:NAD(P)-dependent dehydrogenase (short-subunit alcohol dehydrogenase family)